MDQRDSGKRGRQDGFPDSAPHERLTYGMKGAKVTGGRYIEVGRCPCGSSPSTFTTGGVDIKGTRCLCGSGPPGFSVRNCARRRRYRVQ
jgi:hypothetical protein